jgi:hypothetical protein
MIKHIAHRLWVTQLAFFQTDEVHMETMLKTKFLNKVCGEEVWR